MGPHSLTLVSWCGPHSFSTKDPRLAKNQQRSQQKTTRRRIRGNTSRLVDLDGTYAGSHCDLDIRQIIDPKQLETHLFFYSLLSSSISTSIGGSSVLCSVVGPAEVKIRDEQLDKATVEVVARPLVGLPSVKDKAREQNIRETLEPILLSGLHPRTLIQIVVQTMKDDGCVRLFSFFLS